MKEIGIGVIGTGFMGKAHSIAYSASASVFGTGLRPRLEIVCDLSPERASQRATDLGFSRYSDDWRAGTHVPDLGRRQFPAADAVLFQTRKPRRCKRLSGPCP